ncbi:MAG: ABC transporter substrate-binding protein [Defluviicoccus sp.]|nr:ABC transporter substrate-binding protein [Defluviicoccus sp.]
MLKPRAIAIAAAVLVAAAPALGQKAKNTLRVGFYDPIPGVDLVYDPKGETAFTARAVFDTLISYDERTKKFEPLLAKSWKTVNPTTYEFTLRDDIKFHDGSPLDADDVVYTLNFLADPKVKFRIKSRFLWIKKAEKAGSHTVRVTTKGPRAVALARFAVSIPIFPSDVHGALENKAAFGKKPVGTGPYKVVAYDPNTGVRMVRNPDYRHGSPSRPAGSIETIHILPIPDVQNQVALLITGGLDMIHNVPKDQAENLAQNPDLAVAVSNGILYRYIAFDAIGRTGSDDLKDARVRRALIHAIDRDSIRRNIFAGGDAVEKMDSICKPIQIGCVFDVKPPTYDPKKAKALLAEAGKADLKLQITTLPEARKVAEAVVGYLRAVGVKASIKSVTFGAYRKLQRTGKIQTLVHQFSSGGVPDTDALVSFYFGSKARNYYGDKQIAGWMKQAGASFDIAAREALYRKIFNRINEQAYIVPIAGLPSVFVHAKNLEIDKGIINPFGADVSRIRWK